MAISITTGRNDYTGDGVTLIFPYVFKILTAQDLNVIVSAAGVETPLVYPTDFAVSGIGQTNGGSITTTVAPALGSRVTVRRIRALVQTTSIRNENSYFAATHEDAFDKLLMLDQQQQEEINRRVRIRVSENALFSPQLPFLYGQVSKAIGTNATGDGLALGPSFSDISNANASALAAAASATAAATSATSAATSVTSSASSASAAAASAVAAALSAAAAIAAGFDTTGSPHSVTDGQAATDLSGETFNSATKTSALLFFEIVRGTSVAAVGSLSLNYLNSSWRIVEGNYTGEIHGVTWSLTGTTTAQLQAALDVGAGNGTIKFKKVYF